MTEPPSFQPAAWLSGTVGRFVPGFDELIGRALADSGKREAHETASRNVRWLHDEMVRIEDHWTTQIQNQQRRIGAVLAVNGFLLAFLAVAGLGDNGKSLGKGWFLYPFYLSLVLLSIALVFGMILLLPRIPIGGSKKESAPTKAEVQNLMEHAIDRSRLHESRLESDLGCPSEQEDPALWLDSYAVFKGFRASLDLAELDATDAVVLKIAENAARNADWNREHLVTERRRRRWLHWECGFILLGILSLIVTVIGAAQHAIA